MLSGWLTLGCDARNVRDLKPQAEPQFIHGSSREEPPPNDATATDSEAPRAEPFAVVELFTSEGCSSCPPADEVLMGLAERADAGERVFALSFHVDYWNYLGWRDPFSQKRFSERQRSYANHAFSGRVYTPQAVINGRVELVGSRRAQVHAAVESALRTAASVGLRLQAEQAANGVEVRYRVAPGSDSGARSLIFALVQANARLNVAAGENAGRTLEHKNVVRALVQRDFSAQGELTLEAPEQLPAASLRVVAYAQTERYTIIGAESIAVSPAP